MKIKKRQSPIDFQRLAGEELSPAVASFAPEVTPDLDLDAAAPPLVEMVEPDAGAPLTPTPNPTEVTHAAPTPPARVNPMINARSDLPSGWPIYLAALFVSVLWAMAPIAFAYGYRRSISPFDFDGFALTVLAAMAIGPAALVWIGAYLIRQGQKLGAETRRAKRYADEMVAPAMNAAANTTDVVQTVRDEIVRAGQAADEARETLLALRQALAVESEQLVNAAAGSARTASQLVETLGRERTEMGGLASVLDAQATAVSDTITQQARMVAEASDLAETQLREAEAALAARAADLAAAAGEASDAARLAGEDLTRHIARLETAGVGVADQISSVEQGLTEQRAGLVTIAHALRAEQEAFGAQSETHVAQMSEFISQARLSTAEMGDRVVMGGEALRQLIADAASQFRDLAEAAKAERDEFGRSTLDAMGAVADAAGAERSRLEAQTREAISGLARAAEETRTAAERHAETARDQVDQLSEAAFTAGQKANKVFETRLAEARDLIERSAQMVEQAGAATVRKLDEGATAARATLDELAGMMAEIEARAARLPAAARGQAQEVRQAVSDSIEDLMDQARRTSRETQAIDAAFQDRVRQNYEMLSEAVRLMGSVAGAAGSMLPRGHEEPPAPTYARRRPISDAPTFTRPEPPELEPTELELTEVLRAPAKTDPIRPRLKLTPTATDEEFTQVFEAASGRATPAVDAPGWTWKDLLSSMDDETTPETQSMERALAAAIAEMGIDPTALLPKLRIDEISAAIQTDDVEGAREVVRRLAPAATRRLARKLFTDEPLRQRAVTYLDRYRQMLADAGAKDHEGFLVAKLLGTDAGRTYLLLDAAAGDFI